jgi:hypothetical protein
LHEGQHDLEQTAYLIRIATRQQRTSIEKKEAPHASKPTAIRLDQPTSGKTRQPKRMIAHPTTKSNETQTARGERNSKTPTAQ